MLCGSGFFPRRPLVLDLTHRRTNAGRLFDGFEENKKGCSK